MIDAKKIKNFKKKKMGVVVLSVGIIGTFCSCSKENNSKTESGSLISQHNNNDISSVEYHSPENIKDRGELIVGVAAERPEFYKDKDDNDAGYAVDLSKEIAKEIGEGVQVKFVEDKSEELLNKVANGEIDLAMASLDDENILEISFALEKSCQPWIVKDISLYSKNGEESNYTSQESLNSKKIAVTKDSVALNTISAYAPYTEVVECENIQACIEKVLNGEADLVGAEDAEWTGDGADNPDISKCSITVPVQIGVPILLMQDNQDLKNLIDKVINIIRGIDNEYLVEIFQNATEDLTELGKQDNSVSGWEDAIKVINSNMQTDDIPDYIWQTPYVQRVLQTFYDVLGDKFVSFEKGVYSMGDFSAAYTSSEEGFFSLYITASRLILNTDDYSHNVKKAWCKFSDTLYTGGHVVLNEEEEIS